MTKKKVISLIFACILSVGIISVGVITYALSNIDTTPYENDNTQVSEYFYLQIYNSDGQIVSKYKIALTGIVSSANRKISSVSFNCVFGDTCETNYDIDGDTAYIAITHPTEGCLVRFFTLSAEGRFSGH